MLRCSEVAGPQVPKETIAAIQHLMWNSFLSVAAEALHRHSANRSRSGTFVKHGVARGTIADRLPVGFKLTLYMTA